MVLILGNLLDFGLFFLLLEVFYFFVYDFLVFLFLSEFCFLDICFFHCLFILKQFCFKSFCFSCGKSIILFFLFCIRDLLLITFKNIREMNRMLLTSNLSIIILNIIYSLFILLSQSMWLMHFGWINICKHIFISKVISSFICRNHLSFDLTFLLGINVLDFSKIVLLLYFHLFVLDVFFL